jgi:outer membrane immunogenic protein
MKKLALSVAALAISAGAALAADLPSRKAPILPPPPPPPPMWTGFYVGLNAGGAWSGNNGQYIGVGPVATTPGSAFDIAQGYGIPAYQAFSSAASASTFNSNNGGFIGGGQIGYNWQFMGNFVAGLEADIQGLTTSSGGRTEVRAVPVSDPNGSNFVGTTSARGNLQYLGTVRGRLGYLVMPTLLVYGTGGLAYGGVSLNTATTVYNDFYINAGGGIATGGVNFSNTQVGWTAGGGLEWMFMPNWSAKVEYLYYDLGTVTQNFSLAQTDFLAGTTVFGGQARARVNGNIVRAGVNYHFNWGSAAPVVAKY